MNSQLRADNAQYAPYADGKYPDAKGRYGAFGGRYVPETLVPALDRLQAGVTRHLVNRWRASPRMSMEWWSAAPW
jgi:tryptophan synthase beta chain